MVAKRKESGVSWLEAAGVGRLEAVTRRGRPISLLEGPIWLPLVDPKLEVGANIKETNSYSSGPGHFV